MKNIKEKSVKIIAENYDITLEEIMIRRKEIANKYTIDEKDISFFVQTDYDYEDRTAWLYASFKYQDNL